MINHRHKIFLLFALLGPHNFSYSGFAQSNPVLELTLEKNITQTQDQRMPVYIGLIGVHTLTQTELDVLKKDLERSGQFVITLEKQNVPSKKQDITDLSNKNYALAFFISGEKKSDQTRILDWRLYDTTFGDMVKGQRLELLANNTHMLADIFWHELMGAPSCFTKRLCYVKHTPILGARWATQLCVSDYDGEHAHVIFSSPCILVAPVWNKTNTQLKKNKQKNTVLEDTEKNYIICSEFTPKNVRLVTINLMGKKKVALNFDGTTVGASCSSDGNTIIYGHSGSIWRYTYDQTKKQGKHSRLINGCDATTASPNILKSGDIIYGSNGKIKRFYNVSGKIEDIIFDGYSVAPTVHEPSHTLVYSHKINGVVQLFMHSLKTGKKEQLTFGRGFKTDPAISPCGNWVAYCIEQRGKSQIMLLHVKTKKTYVLTNKQDNCKSPAWEQF